MSTLLKCLHCVNSTFRNKHQSRQHMIVKYGNSNNPSGMKENEEDNSENSGFFSKFLMGGTRNFRSPSVPDGDVV